MYWPDTNTVADSEPARKPVASAVRKFFTEGGPGVPPTVPGGDWFNQITNELLSVLAAAGIEPSKVDDGQLLLAIQNIVSQSDASLRSDLSSDDGATRVGTSSGKNVQEVLDSISPAFSNNFSASNIARKLANGIAQKGAFYGNSALYGYKAFSPSPADQVAVPPPAAMQSLMSQLQLPFTAFNRAISSTSLASMLDGTDGSGSTFAEKVNSGGIDHDANIIYCNHAINDARANVDIDTYRQNLVEFIRLCRNNNIVPVLVTPNPNPPTFTVTEEDSRRLVFFSDAMKSVAEEYAVDLVDQYLYFERSQAVESMVSMVPDGIHPSDNMYVLSGQNLAIPLISPMLISENVNGLTGISYSDNLSSKSFVGLGGRVGLTLTATRGVQPQALHVPVLFGEAKFGFSLYGSESSDEDKLDVKLNGFSFAEFTDTKIHGNTSSIDNDYRCMLKVPVHAGLQLISLSFNAAAAPGDSFNFSGISYSEDSFDQYTTNSDGSSSKLIPFCSGYSAIVNAVLDGVSELVFSDRSNAPVVRVKNVSYALVVELLADGVVVTSQTSPTFLINGPHCVQISVSDVAVLVSAGSAGVSVPISRKLPALFLYTKALKALVY